MSLLILLMRLDIRSTPDAREIIVKISLGCVPLNGTEYIEFVRYQPCVFHLHSRVSCDAIRTGWNQGGRRVQPSRGKRISRSDNQHDGPEFDAGVFLGPFQRVDAIRSFRKIQ